MRAWIASANEMTLEAILAREPSLQRKEQETNGSLKRQVSMGITLCHDLITKDRPYWVIPNAITDYNNPLHHPGFTSPSVRIHAKEHPSRHFTHNLADNLQSEAYWLLGSLTKINSSQSDGCQSICFSLPLRQAANHAGDGRTLC